MPEGGIVETVAGVTAYRRGPLVLAGGLDSSNVTDAIRQTRPWAVDVSSGVEVGKGLKDAARMAAFIRGVRDADV